MSHAQLRVALLGTNFMGRAHSNAWSQVRKFFSPAVDPVMAVACGRDLKRTKDFAERWGWSEHSTDWRSVVERKDIDIVDIALPTHLHHAVALAAAKAGKHVLCEKPMATSLEEAREMLHAVQKAGVISCVNHNYRRVPAVLLAKRLIEEGGLGRIFHWRCAYQQDSIIDPNFPLTWHLRQELAGAGPHADLNSHSVDLAHFLVGDIKHVSCLTSTFIDRRPLPGTGSATFSQGKISTEMGSVTVEDAALMMATFANGALGSFEATRFATGRKNRNMFELYGSHGSLAFDLERMNELQHFDNRSPEGQQGFRTILVTDPVHPYMSHWWPPGHMIGYEHTFIHSVMDFMTAIAEGKPVSPNFIDGLKVMSVLDAGLCSAKSGKQTVVDYETNALPLHAGLAR